MSRVALDANILVYAELEPESEKGKRAAEAILRAARDGVVAAQALGEFLRVVQRKAPGALVGAARQVALYRASFRVPPTTPEIISGAADLAIQHRLQVWDAVICAASAHAGARVLLTEDMQDGMLVRGIRLINPFNAANNATLDSAF